jgi:hypothetical protein
VLNLHKGGRVERFRWLKRARAFHRPTGRVMGRGHGERRTWLDMWLLLIGWADFYLIFIFKLNYFIAN